MKLNTRSILVLAGLGSVMAANAGQVTFFLAYGDATFAGLNGKSVGTALSTSAVNLIPTAVGASYTVSVYAVNSGTGDQTTYANGFSSGAIFVGYDSANVAFTNYNTGAADNLAAQAAAETAGTSKFISVVQDSNPNPFTNPGTVSERKSSGSAKNTTMGSQAMGFYTSALAADGVSSGAVGARSIGAGNAISVDPGYRFTMATGVATRLWDITFKNNVNMSGKTYGSLGQGGNGLTLNNFTGPSSNNNGNNNNFLNGAAGQYIGDGAAYTIGDKAVPEPSTLAALIAGVAVMARRRRK